MKLFNIIMITIALYSCNKNKDFPINDVSNYDKEFYTLKSIKEGDTVAYSNLQIYYLDYPIEGILNTAIIMANKYEYHSAYFDVYQSLVSYYKKSDKTDLSEMDKKTREMALDYLKIGAEKGNNECKRILGYHMIKGTFIKKDSLKGIKLIEEADN